MKRVMELAALAGIVTGLAALSGCNRQAGYFHSKKMFTDADRAAIARVQASVLGKPEMIKSIITEMEHQEPTSVAPCTYKVSKVVRRDLTQTNGQYAEEMHVICLTAASELHFKFEWVVDQNQKLSDFRFGYDMDVTDD